MFGDVASISWICLMYSRVYRLVEIGCYNGHVSLLQLKELNLFLPANIFWEVPSQELSPKHSPSNYNTFILQNRLSTHQPVISFFSQHVRAKAHHLNIVTLHNSEDPLVRIVPSLECWWMISQNVSSIRTPSLPPALCCCPTTWAIASKAAARAASFLPAITKFYITTTNQDNKRQCKAITQHY